MRWPFVLRRDAPTETFDTQVSRFWSELEGLRFSPWLIERIGVASRCLHMSANAVARMPLRFDGSYRPAWVSNPDPVWFPNGIGDALYAAIKSFYGWGDAFLYVTGYYNSGYPSGWTLLDASRVEVKADGGRKSYRINQDDLDPARVVQISRNPGALRGTSALRAYAGNVNGALHGQEVAANGVPSYALRPQKRVDRKQAEALQLQWAQATADRRGLPPVLPPDLDLEKIGLAPKDVALLETREFDSRQICSAFGIPSFLLNLPLEGGLTYQNPEMLFDIWYRTELSRTADAFAEAMSAQLLPAGNSVKFDARELLAPGMKDWHTIWKEAFEDKLVSADEYRRAVLSLGPLDASPTLDELTQPAGANVTTLTPENVQPIRPVEVATA